MSVAVSRNTRQWAGSPERYTPKWLMSRITSFLGDEWFDPCPASYGTVRENGLIGSWRGLHVYCNPPYGRAIAPWITKAMTEPAREVILLLPAYTDARWFAPLYDHTICFVSKRLTFDRPDGEWKGHGGQSPHPSVLVYRGRRYRQFADAFSDLGPIMRTYQPKRAPQLRLLEAS